MIPNNSVSSAINIVEELDKRKVFLAPISDTPLERLVQVSDIAEVTTPGVQSLVYEPSLEEIVQNSNTDTHAEDLEQLGETIATTVQNHISFAKNIVKPAIKDLVGNLETAFIAISENVKKEADIKIYDLPLPMLEVSFEQDVNRFSDLPHIPVTTTLKYTGEIPSGAEIIELLKTGDGILDNAIGTWAINQGDTFFSDVFTSIVDSSVTSVQTLMEKDLNVSVFVYLFSIKLYDNPIDGFVDELAVYNTKIVDLRNQSAIKIAFGYQAHRAAVQSGLLIKDYDANQITVLGDVYRDWETNGGNKSAIYGSLMLNSPKLYVSDINSESAELVDRWQSSSRLILASIKSKEFQAKKQALGRALNKLVDDNFETFYGHLVPEGSTVSRNIPEYKEFQIKQELFINKLRESDFLNIWDVCTNAVCDTVFYYTSSKDLLVGINEHIKNNPELTVREAILLSTIDYVAKFVCSQIETQY